MTNEEALKRLKACQYNNGACQKCKFEFNCDIDSVEKLSIEAIKKQIPMNPTHAYKRLGFTVEGCCPICGNPVVFGKRCNNNDCGQAISWE